MIKIEVTGNSLAEVADKLLAIGTSLHTAGSMFGIDAPQQPVEPKKATRGTTAAKAMATEIVEEKGKADAVRAETSASTAGGTGSSTETKTVAEVAEPATPDALKALDFDKDVAPVVLNAVKVHSKEWVQEVLSQFGVARASQVPDEQLAELLAALQAGPQ